MDQDLDEDPEPPANPQKATNRAIRQFQSLGYSVTITPSQCLTSPHTPVFDPKGPLVRWRTSCKSARISGGGCTRSRPDAQGEALKTRKVGAICIGAAMALVSASALPAQAATTSVSGSPSCPVGQVVWVSVTTQYSASASFNSGSLLRYTDSGGYNHVLNYGTRTANWRVESGGNIQTVSDWCTGNATRPNE